MTSKQAVNDFLAQKKLALVGLSRSCQAFSNGVHQELKARGYTVYPVNPNATSIGGEPCYPSLTALPEKVGGALFFTPSTETEKAIHDALAAGVTRLWLQQGCESQTALRLCEENHLDVVSGECILMYLQPVPMPHTLHRWVWQAIGKMPN